MDEFRTVWRKVERKTFLKGKLRGKYIGFLKKELSDLTHENFYDIEILEAEILVDKNNFRKWDEGEFEEFKLGEIFLTKLPTILPCSVNMGNGIVRNFNVKILAPKVFDTKLSQQLKEDERIFGTIEGDISGYIVHEDMESFEERIVYPHHKESENTGSPRSRNGMVSGGLYSNYISEIQRTNSDDSNNQISKNENQTLSHRNQIPVLKEPPKSIWKSVGELLQLLAFLALVFPILYSLRYFLGIIAVWIVFYFIVAFIQPVLRFFGKAFIALLGITFAVLFITAFINFLSNRNSVTIPVPENRDTSSERTHNEIIPGDEGIVDSIVIHHREWKDYNGREYSGNIMVKVSDFRGATQFRNQVNWGVSNDGNYSGLVNLFYQHDQDKLSGLYSLFDSIKVANNLTETQFAEMIVSCIQDIPYTLILDDICSPWKYNDAFIKEYLLSGGRCRPYTKYGLLTPVEFMATLDGDCDTRSLLLYLILKHYGYDVLMLSSTYYRHAVIAINLPYPGIAKFQNGKRYVIWETTQSNIKPGIFSPQFSDMRFWSLTLPSIETN